jgi:hypothetical protein
MSVGLERRSWVRYVLGTLLAVAALNAMAGGYYGLSGARGVPLEWLEGSPFRSYFVPSLVLLVVVGGSFITAAVAVFAGLGWARSAALCAAGIVTIWLAVQVAIIGYVSWMQPTTAVAGCAIFGLAWALPSAGDRTAPVNVCTRFHPRRQQRRHTCSDPHQRSCVQPSRRSGAHRT